MRSLLFVPGDSARKFEKARQGEADALILDLEDSVPLSGKDRARAQIWDMLAAPKGKQRLFVRINALDSGLALDDLSAVMPLAPHGIVLPKSRGGADVRHLSAWLDAFEASSRHEAGSTRIIAIATETADSLFGLPSYRESSARLWGLMWGAEDLAASFGAMRNNLEGVYTPPFQLARNLCLAAAAAAGVVAIDAVCVQIRDLQQVAFEAEQARGDGFGAKAVIHPAHVGPVNTAFTPTADEVAWARKIVEAFARSPGKGVLNVDGQMIDQPHFSAAQKILAVTVA